ncbi:YqcI/YcgG family protein [Streptomyces sp. NBC_01508]|uniref:YqcI/YcgG family protein n=1 Tax=Streptomyces sp. NBC_01508 TaxID=2903888 RepID=UPI003864B1C3
MTADALPLPLLSMADMAKMERRGSRPRPPNPSQSQHHSPQTPLDWLPDVYTTFAQTLLSPSAYPCHFGVQGQQRGHNWFAAVDSRLPESHGVPALAHTLLAFREQAWSGPKRQSLVVFVGPPDPDAELAYHHAQFWQLLRDLSALDPAPWPDSVPHRADDPDWQWCFAGEPWFVFASSPGYRARRSRDLGPCLTLVFQTGRVFQGIGGSTVAGQAAKRRVRGRLEEYDGIGPHPALGDPDFSSQYKWRQYALPDDQTVPAGPVCPFRKESTHG